MINTLAIVVLIPMYDKLLAPALRKAGRPITLLQRIGGCAAGGGEGRGTAWLCGGWPCALDLLPGFAAFA